MAQVPVLLDVRALHCASFSPTPWPLVAMICNRNVKTSKFTILFWRPLVKGCFDRKSEGVCERERYAAYARESQLVTGCGRSRSVFTLLLCAAQRNATRRA